MTQSHNDAQDVAASLPDRGKPPETFVAQQRLMEELLSATQPTHQAAEPPTPSPPHAVESPAVVVAPALRHAEFECDMFSMVVSYQEIAENAFSFVLVLPDSESLAIRPKHPMDFVLRCPDVAEQSVTYTGEPLVLKSAGLQLFILLKVTPR